MGFGWAHGHRASGFGPVFKAQASAIGSCFEDSPQSLVETIRLSGEENVMAGIWRGSHRVGCSSCHWMLFLGNLIKSV